MADPTQPADEPSTKDSPYCSTVSGMKRPGSPIQRLVAPEKRVKLDGSLELLDIILPYLRHSSKLLLRQASRTCREFIDERLAGKTLVIMERRDGIGFIVKCEGYGLPSFCPAVIDPSTPNSPDFHYDYPRPHEAEYINNADTVILSDVRASNRLNCLLFHLHPASTVVIDHYESTGVPSYIIPCIEVLKINKRPSCGCYNPGVQSFIHGAKQVIVYDNHERVFLDVADLLASMDMDDGICHLLRTVAGPCVEKLVLGKTRGGFSNPEEFKFALERMEGNLVKHPNLRIWVLMDEMVASWRWEYIIGHTSEWLRLWPTQVIIEPVDVYGRSLDKFGFLALNANGTPFIRTVILNDKDQFEEYDDTSDTETVSYTTTEEGSDREGRRDRYSLVIEPDNGRGSVGEDETGEAEAGSGHGSDSERRRPAKTTRPRIVVTSPSL